MSTEGAEDVSEQARFAAREFVARWERETGEQVSEIMSDRMLFAFEIGFTRGFSEGFRSAYEEATEKLKGHP